MQCLHVVGQGGDATTTTSTIDYVIIHIGSATHVCMQDYAGGMSAHAVQKAQHFFVSSVVPREPTYAYSKDHGVTFSGLGVGLPMAALYVEYMGGSLAIHPHEGVQGRGTCVTIRLPVDGFECK